MLRIGPSASQTPPAQTAPPPPPDPTQAAGAPSDPTATPDDSTDPSQLPMMNHKVAQKIAGYLGPEDGPFSCGGCVFFEAADDQSQGQGSCSIVDGAIDPGGCCNNFTSQAMQNGTGDGDDTDQDADQETPTDQATEAAQAPPIPMSGAEGA